MNKRLLLPPLVVLFTFGTALADEPMRWFKNDFSCKDTAITVLSYCRDEPDQTYNSYCSKQEIIFSNGDKKIRRNLLAKERVWQDDFHAVSSLRCVSTEKKSYLYIYLSNGGNCDWCEVFSVMSLNGKWKLYGRHWYASKPERDAISRHEMEWFKQEPFYLKNKALIDNTP